MNTSSSTSSGLVAAVRRRESEAWSRLLDLYGPLVYCWCRRSGIAERDAEDLVQQVFTKVLQGVDGFRHESPTDTFRGWLRTITKHVVIDHRRQERNRVTATGGTVAQVQTESVPDKPVWEIGVDQFADEGELVRRAYHLIQHEFNEQWQQVFELTVIQGRNAQEVAGEMNMTSATVRQAKSRMLRRLRQELGDTD